MMDTDTNENSDIDTKFYSVSISSGGIAPDENNNLTQCGIDRKNPLLFKLNKVHMKAYWNVIYLVVPRVDYSQKWLTSYTIAAY